MFEKAVLFLFLPSRGDALFSNPHASNGSGCHAGCSAAFARAASAPASAVAELGVVDMAVFLARGKVGFFITGWK
jgi:hypothetical protein